MQSMMSRDEEPGAIKPPFLRWWKSLAIFLFWVALISLAMLLSERRNIQDENSRADTWASAELSRRSEMLAAGLTDQISIANSLFGFTYGSIGPTPPDHTSTNMSLRTVHIPKFEGLAASLWNPSIASMQLQPSGIIWQVYPNGTAEIGHDLLQGAESGPEIQSMITAGTKNVVGPVNLKQGGVAMIVRIPVFVNASSTTRGEALWWGNVAVLVELQTFLSQLGFTNSSSSVGGSSSTNTTSSDVVEIPYALMDSKEEVIVAASLDWDAVPKAQQKSQTISLPGNLKFVLKVGTTPKSLERTHYGTAFLLAILSGLLLASGVNVAYMCATQPTEVVVYAPKNVPFFVIMVDIQNMRRWWREYPEEMIFVSESIDSIVERACNKHHCYKADPTMRRVFCVTARSYDAAYDCALDILIEASEMPVSDILQIEMLGNTLPIRATIHYCTNGSVHFDTTSNKYAYGGSDMNFAEEMHTLCNQYTLQLSDAAKMQASTIRCHFLLVSGKHRKWDAPQNLWCALPGQATDAMSVDDMYEGAEASPDGFDPVPQIIGPDESSATMGDVGRRDVALASAPESQEGSQIGHNMDGAQPLPLLRTTEQGSFSSSSAAGGAVQQSLRLQHGTSSSINSASAVANAMPPNTGGSIVGVLMPGGQHPAHSGSGSGRRGSEFSVNRESISQPNVQVGNTAVNSVLVKILREAGEARLMAPDVIAVPKLFFEAYRILFLGFRAAERNNIFQRLRTSFGLPMTNTVEHLAVRAAIMFLDEEDEGAESSMSVDHENVSQGSSAPFSPAASGNDLRRSGLGGTVSGGLRSPGHV